MTILINDMIFEDDSYIDTNDNDSGNKTIIKTTKVMLMMLTIMMMSRITINSNKSNSNHSIMLLSSGASSTVVTSRCVHDAVYALHIMLSCATMLRSVSHDVVT